MATLRSKLNPRESGFATKRITDILVCGGAGKDAAAIADATTPNFEKI